MRIPLQDCVARRLYKLGSHNLVLGVFDGVAGFIGIRGKGNHEYLFKEYHFDIRRYDGTVHSVEHAGMALPPGIEVVENFADGSPNQALFDWLLAKEHELLPEHRKMVEEIRARVAREDAEDDADDGA